MLAKPEGRPMKLFLVGTDSVWAGEDAAEVREAVADSLYIEPGDVPALQEVIGDAPGCNAPGRRSGLGR